MTAIVAEWVFLFGGFAKSLFRCALGDLQIVKIGGGEGKAFGNRGRSALIAKGTIKCRHGVDLLWEIAPHCFPHPAASGS